MTQCGGKILMSVDSGESERREVRDNEYGQTTFKNFCLKGKEGNGKVTGGKSEVSGSFCFVLFFKMG